MHYHFSSTGQNTRIMCTSTAGQSSGFLENDQTVNHQDEQGEASDFRLKL